MLVVMHELEKLLWLLRAYIVSNAICRYSGACRNLPSLTAVVRRTTAVASARAATTKSGTDTCLPVGATLTISRDGTAVTTTAAELTLAAGTAVGTSAPAVPSGRAAGAEGRARTRLPVGATLTIGRYSAATTAAGAKARLAPGTAVICRATTVAAGRATVSKA